MNPSQGVPLATYESHVPDYVPAYRQSILQLPLTDPVPWLTLRLLC